MPSLRPRLPTLLLLGVIITPGGVGAAADATTGNVRLSRDDRSSIETLACRAPHGVAADLIKASRAGTGARSIEVHVQCQPHTREVGAPALHDTTCNNAKGLWQCAAGRTALQIELPGRRRVAVIASGARPDRSDHHPVHTDGNAGDELPERNLRGVDREATAVQGCHALSRHLR
jgi:hypothetical protein